jgi:hypothetical protein
VKTPQALEPTSATAAPSELPGANNMTVVEDDDAGGGLVDYWFYLLLLIGAAALVVAKLSGALDWSWWVVLLPLWLLLAVYFGTYLALRVHYSLRKGQ